MPPALDEERISKAQRTTHVRQALKLLEDGVRETAVEATPREIRLVSESWREIIETTMAQVDRYKNPHRYGITLTKTQKTAAKQFAAALRRLEIRFNNPRLADDVRFGFPLDKAFFAQWIERADMAAGQTLIKKRSNHAKRFAAQQALWVLTTIGLDAPLMRTGRFCRLAALIYGEPKADFLQHCRVAKTGRLAKKSGRALGCK